MESLNPNIVCHPLADRRALSLIVGSMTRAIVTTTLILTLLPSRVHAQSKEPAMPPEIKKTVDAFVGP